MQKILHRPAPPWLSRGEDLGQGCPARGPMLRTELCQIGCQSTRAPLPIYQCQIHTECCPWRWEQSPKMKTCLDCVASGQRKIAESQCSGC